MKIIYEKLKGALPYILLCFLGISVLMGFRDFNNFRDEYRIDCERADTERARYLELSGEQLESIEGIRDSIGESTERIESVETELGNIRSLVTASKDTAVGIGITSDRNLRLLEELRERVVEGADEE